MKYYFKHRLLFGYGGMGVGILLFVMSFIGFFVVEHFEEYLFLIVIILLAVILSTSISGAGLNITDAKLFKYYSIVGMKIHDKKTSLTDYSCILILKYNLNWVNYSRTSIGTRNENGFTVTLANSDHRKKFDLAIFDSKVSALEQAEVMSKQLKIPLAQYNPPRYTTTRR